MPSDQQAAGLDSASSALGQSLPASPVEAQAGSLRLPAVEYTRFAPEKSPDQTIENTKQEISKQIKKIISIIATRRAPVSNDFFSPESHHATHQREEGRTPHLQAIPGLRSSDDRVRLKPRQHVGETLVLAVGDIVLVLTPAQDKQRKRNGACLDATTDGGSGS